MCPVGKLGVSPKINFKSDAGKNCPGASGPCGAASGLGVIVPAGLAALAAAGDAERAAICAGVADCNVCRSLEDRATGVAA